MSELRLNIDKWVDLPTNLIGQINLINIFIHLPNRAGNAPESFFFFNRNCLVCLSGQISLKELVEHFYRIPEEKEA